jgi:branched-chain amino acid transport system permease protein
MVDFLQAVAAGISSGCIYGLVAIGVVLIYKATEVVNFAQGELMMIGAFLAFTFIVLTGLPYWVAFILMVALMALFGMGLDRILIRPLVGYPTFSIVMVTIGFGILARSIVSVIPGWGTETYGFHTPFVDQYTKLGKLVLSNEQLAVIGIALILIIGLFCFFRFTRIGIAMQAVSENQLAATYMGISVKNVFSLIWALSAAVAGFAGILLAPITFVHVNMGFLGLKAFPAAVLGGLSSVPGAIVGGLVIGITESLAGLYLPIGWKDMAAYIILIFVLIIRPEGIFGNKERKKV